MKPVEGRTGAGGFAVLCDHQGRIVRVVGDGLGLAAHVQPGAPFAALVHPDCAGKANQFLEALRRQNAAFNWELTVPLGDGRLAAMHFAGGASDEGFLIVGAKSRAAVASTFEGLVSINNEQTTMLRAAMKDLALRAREQADREEEYYDELTRLNNELATTQRELAKKNAELARLNEQKNQFLGIAAHDLRNPLDVILTYSQFVLDEARAALTPEQIEFVNTIRSSSEFMLNLVNDLLDTSKIEAGKLELELERVDLGEIVRRNVALNRTLAERKGITLALARSDELPAMRLDVSKIEQVLNNLIGNAVKFSPPGSRVEVRIEREDDGAVVSVRDEGEGIAAEELDNLFRFYEKGRTRATGGEKSTGLGLAIVKKIVAGHGGEIRVESEAGEGATFFVSLPASPVKN